VALFWIDRTTLRKYLVDIRRAFVRHYRLKLIEIPTSGCLLVDRTIESVEEILKIEPQFRLSIIISIDGMEGYRRKPGRSGLPGDRALRLLELKKKTKRLQVDILTTLVGDMRRLLLLKTSSLRNCR
jgi:hypothetical protein